MRKYTKPPLSIPDQISRLKERGLKFIDEDKAALKLSNISYYRLRAYTYPFQDNNNHDHPFITKVTFEEIISLYNFDRKLRILVFDAIEKVEIALRTKIIYEFSLKYGSHWHEDINRYRIYDNYKLNMQSLHEEIERSSETFIEHYKSNYCNPKNPPAWMSLEIISIGLLSKLFSNLKKDKTKRKVSKNFGIKKVEIFESWLHSLVGLRNICAHHSRLWNRRFTIKPIIPYNTEHQYIINREVPKNKLYIQLCNVIYLLNIIDPGHYFVRDFKKLLAISNLVNCHDMGMPANWQDETLWT